MSSYQETISKLNIQLPKPPKPVGAYRPVVVEDGFAFLSGQISKPADGKLITGKVGKALTLDQGKNAARVAALNVVSIIQSEIGFDRFERILRVVGYVQSDPEFQDIHLVMNGASDLFKEIFGEKGIHARSAVGMASLPLNAAVEIEVTVKVRSS